MTMTELANGLRKYLERNDMTLEELVDTADGLLGRLAPRQTRYKVTERPDARTIRYYVTQGLLPKPLSYDGGRARYGGTHLLRLLWIKKLQAEHHTLTRIAALLDSRTDQEVLALIAAAEEAEEATAEPDTPGEAPRLAVGANGTVMLRELPLEVLSDPKKRKKLADSLEALAAWLRETGGKA
jgi:DNA-binding transcriptional MerR regulator